MADEQQWHIKRWYINAGAEEAGISDFRYAHVVGIQKIQSTQMLNIQTIGTAIDHRQESAAIETSARTAAMRSPHPTLLAKSELNSEDTNPDTRKFIPKNLNAWKAARSLRAS